MIKKVTILEIAAELGLSRNTVSKALNNDETVAYDTRLMVVKKAWEMGYQKMSPMLLEEFKITDRPEESRTVAILAKREFSVFWNTIIMGISDELNSCGCSMRLSFISEEDEHTLALPRDLQDKLDGIIFMGIFEPDYTKRILKLGIPAVFLDYPIGRYAFEYNCDAIVCEGKTSVYKLTKSLIEQGLKTIGFIGDINYCESMRQRYEGYVDALISEELRFDKKYILTESLPENYSHREIERMLHGIGGLPDAFVCANDDIAIKAARALKKRGFSVPEDIALTGFDNEEILTQTEPILTTVEVHNHLLGKRLVAQLLWRIMHPEFPRETVYIETKPIFRVSSMKKK